VELHGAVFVNTPRFFDKFFDVPPSVVDHISTEIHTQGYYDSSRWAAFPNKKDFLEKDLYVPFVDAANFITSQCSSTAKDVRWLTDANRSPVSDDTKAADVEPDIVCIRGFPLAIQPVVKTEEGAAVWSKLGKIPKLPKAPWRRIQVPVEVKKVKSNRAASLQLFKYIRQVFHESFDCRFVFGIVLARSNITVYLAD
jgi:hypothetical protein